MPFTLRNIKKDLDDIGSAINGAPELEFRAATKALRLEKAALSYQYVPPGYRFPYGHTHETQEEVYVVVGGSGRMKLDDEVVELEAWDAVRVPPGRGEGTRPGPRGSRSSSSARPTLARIREAMSTASVTGGPTRRPRVPLGLRSAVRARADAGCVCSKHASKRTPLGRLDQAERRTGGPGHHSTLLSGRRQQHSRLRQRKPGPVQNCQKLRTVSEPRTRSGVFASPGPAFGNDG